MAHGALLPQGYLFADEVNVYLHVLHAAVMDRVGRHIDNTNIFVVDNRRRRKRDMELLEKLAKPTTLGNYVCHRTSALVRETVF